MAQMNLSTKQKQTHRHREQTCGCWGEGGEGEMDWKLLGVNVEDPVCKNLRGFILLFELICRLLRFL